MKRTLATYTLAALAAFFLFGCKTATEPSTGGNTTVVHPGVGSSYTYHSTSKDSTGAVTNESDYTMNVAAVNVAFGGRTDAIKLVDADREDTTYYSIQSNGDLLMYVGDPSGVGMGSATWIKLPFSGGAGASMTLIDTTGDLLDIGIPVHMVGTITTAAAGSESIATAGKTFNARKVNMTMNLQMTVMNKTTATTIEQNIWFGNEIGNMIKTYNPSYKDASTDKTMDSQTDILTAFSLK